MEFVYYALKVGKFTEYKSQDLYSVVNYNAKNAINGNIVVVYKNEGKMKEVEI
jgi:hypothetical protein